MKIQWRFAAALAACALALGAGTAIAHGNDHPKHSDAPVKKEQQPWGIAGDAKGVTRTIRIAMGDDMRFAPSAIQVRQGETVRFVVTNQGAMLHEMVIGTRQALEQTPR